MAGSHVSTIRSGAMLRLKLGADHDCPRALLKGCGIVLFTRRRQHAHGGRRIVGEEC